MTIPVSGAQLRVRFASIASKYAGGSLVASRLSPTGVFTRARIERPSKLSGAAIPTRSSSVGVRSISRTRPSNARAAILVPAQITHGTLSVTS